MIPSAKMIAEPPHHARQRPGVPGPLEPGTEGKGHRDADDGDEEREHHVGEGPAVPGGVAKRRINGGPVPGLLTSTIPATVRPRSAVERDEAG